jgi:hypothetical protein
VVVIGRDNPPEEDEWDDVATIFGSCTNGVIPPLKVLLLLLLLGLCPVVVGGEGVASS